MKIERQTGCGTQHPGRPPATGLPRSLRRASSPCPLARAAHHQPPAANFPWPPSGGRLIANLELEFSSSHRKHSQLQISNRKFLPLFHPNRVMSSVRSSLATSHSPLACPQGASRQRRATEFPWTPWCLIGTLEKSKNQSTRTKQTTKQISNRYKTRILCPSRRNAVSRFSRITSYESVVTDFRPASFAPLPHLITVSTPICTLNERNSHGHCRSAHSF
jgi:hypothetical protein